MSVSVRLEEAADARAEYAAGSVVYRGGHRLGSVILRAAPTGVEDFIVVDDLQTNRLDYEVELGREVAGLRLVGDTLELLDETGDPRLRVAPPYLIDGKGEQRIAMLSVSDCAVDTSPVAPWGRPITPPDSSICRVSVTWDAAGLQAPLLVDPSWATTGNMSTDRQGHVISAPSRTTGQTNGLVLAVGGDLLTTSAELYNPTSGTWAATAPINVGRFLPVAINHSQTASGISDDRVLVAGGMINANTGAVTRSATRYRFRTGTWETVPNMASARTFAAIANLDVNKALVAGGASGIGGLGWNMLSSAEVYNFATNTWTNAPAMSQPRGAHTLTRLTTGFGPASVLVAGGYASTGLASTQCQKYNGTVWSAAGTLVAAVAWHTATLCAGGCPPNVEGHVFVAGGDSTAGVTRAIQRFNPSTNSWASAGNLPGATAEHGAALVTVLGEKKVFVAGGRNAAGATIRTATLFPSGPATPRMAIERRTFGTTLLTDGRVLVAGGYRSQSGSSIIASELFTP